MHQHNIIRLATITCVLTIALGVQSIARAQESEAPQPDTEASRAMMLEEFRSLRDNHIPTEIGHLRRLLDLARQLQPEDTGAPLYKETALTQLETLAALARLEPASLGELLQTTRDMKEADLPKDLKAEAAFYGIQAFVLGARYEDMPADKMLRGTQERYEAFIVDYPDSPRVPVIAASLVRNLIEQNKMERATQFVDLLRARFPDDRATERATGELFKARAIGQILNVDMKTPDGQHLRLADHRGKVVVLHFFDSSAPAGLSNLGALAHLHRKYGDHGVQLLGINIDRLRERAETFRDAGEETGKMPWPIFLDWTAARSDLIVKLGVTSVPTVFVLDRTGRVIAVDPGDDLDQVVAELVETKEPATP